MVNVGVITDMTVRENSGARTYDAIVDGRVVGTIVYEHEGQRTAFFHTIVEPEFRGQGIGTRLVREALEDIRAKGTTLSNYCGFVSDFISAHPEYADLIDADHPGHPRRG